ncbi:hypothetical protein BO78DRAFT_405023 [Aspergillus sclerotiicarbonarius CBS 121057]|uniref:Mitochondrial carrier n=1 Tax=Aspergillus sclerotiicarbonarius (strain CBS 121057 / IBT 28362) TaxID=1448318 RepID=A0A319F2F5_ASPSB|nr:hypothetical protein BO78DRAFT_405023 [Aspergillus sclerotiicarbonarius CBS 121057]
MAANRTDSFGTALRRIWARGAVRLETDRVACQVGFGNFSAGITRGMIGGLAQAYVTVGFCTCMKTAEITKLKGVNAVAVRQVTNWGSRFGLSRMAENVIRWVSGKTDETKKLSAGERVLASGLGGGLSAWNQPIEVVRVEMQSRKYRQVYYERNGLRGLYRGIIPRIGLGIWQTVCMVAFGDMAKEAVGKFTRDKEA